MPRSHHSNSQRVNSQRANSQRAEERRRSTDRPTPPRIVEAEFSAGAAQPEQLPPGQYMEIAFAGRSNVGKSSLMNALMERKRLVRTSSTPGCTRQVSLFDVKTRQGTRLCLADLPGYGYAKRSHSERRQWGDLVDGYMSGRVTLALVVALVDIRRGLQSEDEQLLELIAQKAAVSRGKVEVIHVATKLDKLSGSQRKLAMVKLKQQTGRNWLGFSTELPDTHLRLWNTLLKRLDLEQPDVEPASSEEEDLALDSETPLTENTLNESE